MRVLLALAATCLLAGCALDLDGATAASSNGQPERVRISGVPFNPQKGFRCGPAAMASMLGWAGAAVTPDALEGRFYGADNPRTTMIDIARRYGRFAYPIRGEESMAAELVAGHPVLILENLGVASEPLWNCVVAVGYDDDGSKILIHGGDEAGHAISLRLLERLWSDADDWGLVVLRAGDMPATATESGMIDGARGLAAAGRPWEAVLAWDTALSRWPNNVDALMGLGGSLYLLGDLRGAADSYRAAAALASDPAPALSALNQVVAELAQPPMVAIPTSATPDAPKPPPPLGRKPAHPSTKVDNN